MKENCPMKIALVLTPYKDRAFDTISIPLGIAWLISYLKEQIQDIHIDTFDLLLEPERERELIEKVSKRQYEVIGIQAHSNATAREALRIVKSIKTCSKEVITILGGNAATFGADKFLQSGYVDFVVFGEGERTLAELLKAIYSPYPRFSMINGIAYYKSGKVVRTPERELIEDLNELPLPDRDSFAWDKYPQWSIITSRGCPYSCTFCSSTKFWRNCIRFRNADNIFAEIKLLVEKYGVKRLYILDDTFGVNREEITKLLTKMVREDVRLEWACLTRAEVVSEKMLDLFKEAGCVQVHFGLETANLQTQNLIKKHLNLQQLETMVAYCHNIGIRTKLSVIFGLPGETETHIRATIEYLKRLQPNEVQIYPLMPYVGIDVLEDDTIKQLDPEKHDWKQDALVPLSRSCDLSTEKQIELTHLAIEEFKSLGYKWIPLDLGPEKHDEVKIIKTVFAPIQGLRK